MHGSSLVNMRRFRERFLTGREADALTILDLGAADLGGSYKAIFAEPAWTYTGLDLAPGPNVDVVLDNPYLWRELASASCDVFVSGQVFEHIEHIWVTIREIARVLRPGGYCCLIAPSSGPEHKYPTDCWRYLPDGFEALARWGGLVVETSWLEPEPAAYHDGSELWRDCVLVARKPTAETEHVYTGDVDVTAPEPLAVIGTRIPAGSTVLELGPATGYFSKYLKETLGCTLDGVEYSASMAEEAHPYFRKLLVGDLNTPAILEDLGQANYDAVVAADVLEHLVDFRALLAALPAYLAPEGRLYLSVPNAGHASVVAALLCGQFPYQEEGLLDATHLRFFTRASLTAEVEGAGLRVVEAVDVTRHPVEGSLGPYFGSLPEETRRMLLAAPDAMAYQYVLVCARAESRAETASAPRRVGGLAASVDHYGQLATKLARATEHNAELDGALEEARRVVASRDEWIGRLEAEVAALRAGLANAESLAFSRLDELTEAATSLRALSAERDDFRDQAGRYKMERDGAREEAAELAARLERVRRLLGYKYWQRFKKIWALESNLTDTT